MKHLFTIFSFIGLIGLSQIATKVSASEIAVTIKPLHSLVTAVAGDAAQPYLLVSGNSSPHGFKFKPSQLIALSKAKIIFHIDEDFETFMEKALNSIPKSVKKVGVAKSARVQFLHLRKGGAWEEEKHDGHDHGHDHGSNDMHVWLDPKNAVRMAKAIVRALSKVFPENKDIYRSNARKLVASISEADEELENYFAKNKARPFIVFHDAYQYFEKRYGLEGV
ncbi:MAG: metal ABC transporter solute-binding protein, Zn/Mn family, partial [Alphaproteobacteria bacterium]